MAPDIRKLFDFPLAPRLGRINAIYGPMFSGKTNKLLLEARHLSIAQKDYLVFKPVLDDRVEEACIDSHDGDSHEAIVVQSSHQIVDELLRYFHHSKELPDAVLLNEVQFFDEGVVEVVAELSMLGVEVYWAGLDTDWRGVPFHFQPALEGATAAKHIGDLLLLPRTVHDRQYAVCKLCGRKNATMTYRTGEGEGLVQVGGQDTYEARCSRHFYQGMIERGHFKREQDKLTSILGRLREELDL
ncbi:MAG: thymidine kinase [Candidatus Woesearchaeota archaeon]|nr:MAG: thymidine kinase [Candidatus Woesearchaeota archaeon]